MHTYTHPSPAAPVRVGVVSSFNQRPDRSVWHSGGADLLSAPAGCECLRQEEDAEVLGSPHTHGGGADPSNRPHASSHPSHLSLNIHRVQRRWKIHPLAPISKALSYIFHTEGFLFFAVLHFVCLFNYIRDEQNGQNLSLSLSLHFKSLWSHMQT